MPKKKIKRRFSECLCEALLWMVWNASFPLVLTSLPARTNFGNISSLFTRCRRTWQSTRSTFLLWHLAPLLQGGFARVLSTRAKQLTSKRKALMLRLPPALVPPEEGSHVFMQTLVHMLGLLRLSPHEVHHLQNEAYPHSSRDLPL